MSYKEVFHDSFEWKQIKFFSFLTNPLGFLLVFFNHRPLARKSVRQELTIKVFSSFPLKTQYKKVCKNFGINHFHSFYNFIPGEWSKRRRNKSTLRNYNVFHQFRQANFTNGGSILSSSQFLLLPQQPQKMMLALKLVKIYSKIIISLSWSNECIW